MVLLAGAVASAAADGLSNSLQQFHDELQRHSVSLRHLALDTGSRDSVAWCQLRAALQSCATSNQVSTFSRSAMLFRASDPSVASLDTPMVSVGEWYKTAMKGVTPVNK